MLKALGCEAPKTLMAADAHNTAGYWESAKVADLNDDILASAGSSWDSWERFNQDWYSSPVADGFRERTQAVLQDEFGNSPLFVLKDPRICRLTAFWLDAIGDFGAQAHVVLPLRNPVEVAASLEERDAIDRSVGLLMWLRNVLDAEHDSRGQPRAFAHYDDLLDNWQEVAAAIGQQLGIDWPRRSATVDLEVAEGVSPKLRHHGTANTRTIDVAPWVTTTYAILRRWTKAEVHDGDASQLDAIYARLAEATAAFARPVAAGMRASQGIHGLEAEARELKRTVAARDSHIGSLDQAVRDRDEIIAAKDRQIADLDKAVVDRDVKLDAQMHVIAARDGQITALVDDVAARDQRISVGMETVRQTLKLVDAVADRDQRIAAKDQRVAELDEAIAAKNQQIAELDQTVADRDVKLDAQAHAVAAREGQISALEDTLAARDQHIAELGRAVADRDEAGAAKDAHIASLEERFDDLQRSTSWRVTAPLRLAKALLRRPLRLLAWPVGAAIRLIWRWTPLGARRRQRWRAALPGLVPKRMAAALGVALHAPASLDSASVDGAPAYVSSGRIDLADLNGEASRNQGPVPILFDPEYYLASNEDVAAAGVDPLTHYLECGAAEGRLPMDIEPDEIDPLTLELHRFDFDEADGTFDAGFYRDVHPDLAALDDDALASHYERHGKLEGRPGSKAEFLRQLGGSPREIPIDFHANEYVELYPDLQRYADRHPLAALAHYMRSGRWEPRLHTLRSDAKSAARSSSVDLDLPELATEVRPLCVLAHVYYPELWDELSAYLANLPADAHDLYVNLVDTTFDQQLMAKIRADFPRARVYISENAGRDVGGHFRVLRSIRMEDYRIFCLVHTKKSPHMSKGEVQLWRRRLLVPLMGSPETAADNIRTMLADDRIGQIGALKCRYNELNDNQGKYFALLQRLGIDEDEQQVEFLSGTMMFVRREVLRRLLDATADIEFESGDGESTDFHRDGQWAHAVERAIAAVVRDMNLGFVWR